MLLAGLFLVLFLLAVTLNQVVDTASDPEVIIGMVNDAGVYDYVYDDIAANLVSDIVDRGIEVNTGLSGQSNLTYLQFDDPAAAAATVSNLFETLVPREYVREKFEQSLTSVGSYARGESDSFTIDLEVQDRVRAAPDAIRQAVSGLNLTEQVINDLLVPQLDEISAQISGQALGITFTPQEIEDNARLIFDPVWLEGQLFGAIDEIAPYFAGDADSFTVVLRFDDRVVIVGQILKDKLNADDTLYNLVFSQVVDPLVQQAVSQSTSVGFGVTLTEQDVTDALEAIAPREWVREQGDGVIDALVGYLVGNTDELGYTVDLVDRKVAAIAELQSLARRKLQSTLADIPACKTPGEALGASQDLAARKLPRCIAGGQTAITIAIAAFGPTIDDQVDSFVSSQVPEKLSYSLSDFQSQLGGEVQILSNVRQRVIDGFQFTDQDLIDVIADKNDPNSRADAEELLQVLANGVVITEKNIVDNLDPAAMRQLDDVRGYVKLGLSVRWLLWVAMLIPLIGIAFLGGRTWAARLKWAGGVAAVSAIVIYAAISVAWSFNNMALDRIPDVGTSMSDDFRASFPLLFGAVGDGSPKDRVERSLASWKNGWRNQVVPWLVVGALAFAVGAVWPRVDARRAGGGSSGGAAGSPTRTGAGPAGTVAGSGPAEPPASSRGTAAKELPEEPGENGGPDPGEIASGGPGPLPGTSPPAQP